MKRKILPSVLLALSIFLGINVVSIATNLVIDAAMSSKDDNENLQRNSATIYTETIIFSKETCTDSRNEINTHFTVNLGDAYVDFYNENNKPFSGYFDYTDSYFGINVVDDTYITIGTPCEYDLTSFSICSYNAFLFSAPYYVCENAIFDYEEFVPGDPYYGENGIVVSNPKRRIYHFNIIDGTKPVVMQITSSLRSAFQEIIVSYTEHVHKYSSEYSFNDTEHWKDCLKEECSEKITNEHVIVNNSYVYDEESHWHGCSVCNYKSDEAIPHTLDEGILISTPSISSPGEIEYTCQDCNYKKIINEYLNLDDVTIEVDEELTYNGLDQTQKLKVKYNGTLLTEGVHYNLIDNVQKDAGDYSLTITGAGGFEGERTFDYTITKAPLKITVNNKEIKYGDEAPAYYTVTYDGFVNGETESVLDGELTFSCNYEQFDNLGCYAIETTGLSSDNYEITYETGNLIVNPKEVTLTWGNTTLTYNGKEQKPSVTFEGIVNDDTCDIEVEGAGVNVGTYTATVIRLTNPNYILTSSSSTEYKIEPKSIEGAVVNLTNTLYYTGEEQTQEIEVVLDDVVLLATDYTVSGNMATNVGTYTLTVTGQGNITGSIEVEYTVSKTQLTITVENKVVTYGDEAPEYTVTYEGFLSGDDESILSGTLTFECTYVKNSEVGEYVIKASGLSNDNYDITFVDGTLTVNKIVVVIPEVKTHYYYNGSEHTLLTNTDLYTVSGDLVATDVGEYLAILTLVDPDHYKWEDDAFNGEIEWKITLNEYDMSNISFNSKTVIYDGTNQALKIRGVLPTGISVSYSITECIEPGVYEIIATFDGEDLTYYNKIPDMKATLTIKRVQFSFDINGDDEYVEEVIITSPNGIDPSKKVKVELVDIVKNEKDYSEYLNSFQKAIVAYDVKIIDQDGNSTQPESELVIKLLIPNELNGKTFSVMHIHNGNEKTMMDYEIEGDYVIITTDKLSDFVFVYETQLLSILIIFIVVISVISQFALLLFVINKRKKKRVNGISF